MLRNITIILLLGTMLFQVSYKSVVMLHYILYKKEIIAQKCVNKGKPKFKCDGKCHLKKMMDVAETKSPIDNTTLPNNLKKIIQSENLYINHLNLHLFPLFETKRHNAVCSYEFKYCTGIVFSVFHPPECQLHLIPVTEIT